MAQQEGITITILNRNYPPGQGITGESASELAEFFVSSGGCRVFIVHVDAPYSGGHVKESQPGTVYKIKTFYNNKGKLLRLLANVYEGYKMVRKAKKIASDITICMTDPPLLNVWAALLFGRRHKWILWSMDLYPEAFIAGKLVSDNNPLYRLIDSIVKKNPPDHIISLGKHQAEFLKNKYKTPVDFTILPCGIYDNNDNRKEGVPTWARDSGKIYLGYCGNIGEAHCVDFLLSVIRNFDPSRYTLILSLYGSNASKVLEIARGRQGIIIVNSVARSELKFIDVHLASIVRDWVSVSVPSKTVSSVCAGSTFLYNGSEDSDNWELLKDAGWIIEESDFDEQIRDFFRKLNIEDIRTKKNTAMKLAHALNKMKKTAFEQILQKIKELA